MVRLREIMVSVYSVVPGIKGKDAQPSMYMVRAAFILFAHSLRPDRQYLIQSSNLIFSWCCGKEERGGDVCEIRSLAATVVLPAFII